MTLEEKITHLRTTSMEEARAESNAIIDSYRDALEKVFEDHKIEAKRQMQTRIKAETVNARQQKNQAMARAQLDLKRRQGRIQQELKDKIFEEAYALVNDYMKTAEYDDFLLRCIHNAIVFANGEEMTIYLNPSDEEKRSSLEDARIICCMMGTRSSAKNMCSVRQSPMPSAPNPRAMCACSGMSALDRILSTLNASAHFKIVEKY